LKYCAFCVCANAAMNYYPCDARYSSYCLSPLLIPATNREEEEDEEEEEEEKA